MTKLTAIKSQVEEEEPPGIATTRNDVVVEEEEPPGTAAVTYGTAVNNRRRFFSNVTDTDWSNWKWQFRNRITSVEELAHFVPLSANEIAQLKSVTAKYPLSISPYYLSLANLCDFNDPIRKQAVPSFEEISLGNMGFRDPLGEERDSVVPGLVHRYQDRVLMVLTDICPMLCRHCTRKREWHNGGWVRSPDEIKAMLDYIRRNDNVRDVIISGGDPLTLSTRRLECVISNLRQISHVEVIRIGTRFPWSCRNVLTPSCATCSQSMGPYGSTRSSIIPVRSRWIQRQHAIVCCVPGVPVSNQSVLLRGINDSVETQTKLCQGLLKIKVRPYYLFECDEIQGAEHLRTPVETGVKIIEGMRGRTSGLAIPTFVIDLPEGGGKVSLQPNYVLTQNSEELVLRNYQGRFVWYRNPKDKFDPDLTSERKLVNNTTAELDLPLPQLQPVRVRNDNRARIRS